MTILEITCFHGKIIGLQMLPGQLAHCRNFFSSQTLMPHDPTSKTTKRCQVQLNFKSREKYMKSHKNSLASPTNRDCDVFFSRIVPSTFIVKRTPSFSRVLRRPPVSASLRSSTKNCELLKFLIARVDSEEIRGFRIWQFSTGITVVWPSQVLIRFGKNRF